MQKVPEKKEDLKPVMENMARTSLGKIIQKARFLLAADRFLKTILPNEFQAHCQVMNFNQVSTLVIGVNSAAIATRLQLMSTDLTNKIRDCDEFKMVRAVQFKVCFSTVGN